MSAHKMNDDEWDRYIELKRSNRQLKKDLEKKETTIRIVKKFLFSSWLLGIIAGILMYIFFGWNKLFETVLSWTIGVTIVATFVAALPKYDKIRK